MNSYFKIQSLKSMLFVGIVIAGGGLINTANAQKNAWHIFQPNSNCKNISFTSSSTTLGTNFPKPPNDPTTSQPFTEYLSTNVMTDINGKLLFYVICSINKTFLFDKDNKIVDYWNGAGKEIGIVPIDNGIRYHIIAGGIITEYSLATNKTYQDPQSDGLVGKVLLVQGPNYNYTDAVLAIKLKYFNGCVDGYYIYSVSANDNGVTNRSIVVGEYTKSKTGNSSSTRGTGTYSKTVYNITSITQSFNFYISEIDLSSDGSKLAIADNVKILIYNITTSTGQINTATSPTTLSYNNSSNRNRIGGIEFDGNNLVYSVFDPDVSSSSSDVVNYWNVSTGTVSSFASSDAFARSSIKRSKDGKLVVAKSDGLYQLNVSAFTINALLSTLTFYKNIDLYVKKFPPGTVGYFGIYNLPDQIDGQTTELLDLTEVVFSYNFNKAGTTNWTNSAHGFTSKGSGKVIVLNNITISNTKSIVNLDGMTMEFYDDAEFNVYPGGKLNLKGTICKGTDCGLMWKGINMLKGRTTYPYNYYENAVTLQKNASNLVSKIKDAYNGVVINYFLSYLTIKDGSIFEANENDIKINSNIKSKVSITNTFFYGNTILKDQDFGSKNGYDDGFKRTINHVLLVNGDVQIGDIGLGQNYMEGGQNGIQAIGSKLELFKTEITQTKNYGCWMNANKVANKTLKVQQCNFHDLQQGIRVELETKETFIYFNTFTNTGGYAIQYIGNHGGKLWVGDEGNTSLANSFNNCNWAAVECFDNSFYTKPNNSPGYGTNIIIANNAINNHVYATGISVGEPSKAKRSFGIMHVTNNQIGTTTKIGQGVILRQIAGANVFNPQFSRPANYNDELEIRGNHVYFTTAFSPFYKGIYAENSENLNFLFNNINSGVQGDWRPTAIRISEGKNTLVSKNTLQGGNGLQVVGDGMFSNYYCNEFVNCVNGIQLAWNFLRNSANNNTPHNDLKIHANLYQNKIYGRPNGFTNHAPWGADIDVSTTYTDRNQWDFVGGKSAAIKYLKGITLKIVHDSMRVNPCIGETVQSGGEDSLTPFVDYLDITNPVLKWKLKYGITRDYLNGKGSQNINDSALNALVNIEKQIEQLNYVNAQSQLNSFTPSNAIDSAYKKVYAIWVSNRLGAYATTHQDLKWVKDTLWTDSLNSDYTIDTFYKDTNYQVKHYPVLSDSLVQMLQNIAEMDAVLINPAAYPARAILWAEKQLQFNDAPIVFHPNIAGYVTNGCYGGGVPGIPVYLLDSSGGFTGIETTTQDSGYFMLNGNELSVLDSNSNYFVSAFLEDSSWVSSGVGHWYDLAMQSYHVLNCISASPTPFSTAQNKINNKIKVFPNPSNQGFAITDMPENWDLSITDAIGKLVFKTNGCGTTYSFTGNLLPGLYSILIVDTQNNVKTAKKILVQ